MVRTGEIIFGCCTLAFLQSPAASAFSTSKSHNVETTLYRRFQSSTKLFLQADQRNLGSEGSALFTFQPTSEATLVAAYRAWKIEHGRDVDEWDKARYRIFKANYQESKRSHERETARARMEGQPLPPPMKLNKFADLSREEFLAEKTPRKEQKQKTKRAKTTKPKLDRPTITLTDDYVPKSLKRDGQVSPETTSSKSLTSASGSKSTPLAVDERGPSSKSHQNNKHVGTKVASKPAESKTPDKPKTQSTPSAPRPSVSFSSRSLSSNESKLRESPREKLPTYQTSKTNSKAEAPRPSVSFSSRSLRSNEALVSKASGPLMKTSRFLTENAETWTPRPSLSFSSETLRSNEEKISDSPRKPARKESNDESEASLDDEDTWEPRPSVSFSSQTLKSNEERISNSQRRQIATEIADEAKDDTLAPRPSVSFSSQTLRSNEEKMSSPSRRSRKAMKEEGSEPAQGNGDAWRPRSSVSFSSQTLKSNEERLVESSRTAKKKEMADTRKEESSENVTASSSRPGISSTSQTLTSNEEILAKESRDMTKMSDYSMPVNGDAMAEMMKEGVVWTPRPSTSLESQGLQSNEEKLAKESRDMAKLSEYALEDNTNKTGDSLEDELDWNPRPSVSFTSQTLRSNEERLARASHRSEETPESEKRIVEMAEDAAASGPRAAISVSSHTLRSNEELLSKASHRSKTPSKADQGDSKTSSQLKTRTSVSVSSQTLRSNEEMFVWRRPKDEYSSESTQSSSLFPTDKKDFQAGTEALEVDSDTPVEDTLSNEVLDTNIDEKTEGEAESSGGDEPFDDEKPDLNSVSVETDAETDTVSVNDDAKDPETRQEMIEAVVEGRASVGYRSEETDSNTAVGSHTKSDSETKAPVQHDVLPPFNPISISEALAGEMEMAEKLTAQVESLKTSNQTKGEGISSEDASTGLDLSGLSEAELLLQGVVPSEIAKEPEAVPKRESRPPAKKDDGRNLDVLSIPSNELSDEELLLQGKLPSEERKKHGAKRTAVEDILKAEMRAAQGLRTDDGAFQIEETGDATNIDDILKREMESAKELQREELSNTKSNPLQAEVPTDALAGDTHATKDGGKQSKPRLRVVAPTVSASSKEVTDTIIVGENGETQDDGIAPQASEAGEKPKMLSNRERKKLKWKTKGKKKRKRSK